MSKLLRDRKAISPVIATVILVAVAITVAVAVAYWMANIAGTYTATEKIEMPSSYAVYTDDLGWTTTPATSGWKVYIQLKNSGSKDATLKNVFLNEVPLKDYGADVKLWWKAGSGDFAEVLELSAISVPVPKGGEVELRLELSTDTEGCSSGTTVDLKINSAAGNKYPVLVRLP